MTKDDQSEISINRTMYDFSVDHISIKKEDNFNIHQYLMVNNKIKPFLCLLKKSFHTKCVTLSNQKCTTQPTVFNLQSNEYTQRITLLSICN